MAETEPAAAGQSWDPERYARNARFVSDLGQPVVELLAPEAGERILDLGCGDGALTEKLVAAGATVVAVDASAEQVAAARALGLDARVMDGAALDFHGEFDAVFSNAALHWMAPPDRVIAGVARALAAGGRFVAEMGGKGCIETIAAAVIAALARRGIDAESARPWYFPAPEDYGPKLEAGGFRVEYIALIPRPTALPGELSDWLETFAQSLLDLAPEGERGQVILDATEIARPVLQGEDGVWTADYMRLRFRAVKGA